MRLKREGWITLLGGDPREWLLVCDEPAARWVTLDELLDRRADDSDLIAAHAAVLADPGTRALIEKLPDWQVDNHLSGHASPGFAPNLLNLLADMGSGPATSACLTRSWITKIPAAVSPRSAPVERPLHLVGIVAL